MLISIDLLHHVRVTYRGSEVNSVEISPIHLFDDVGKEGQWLRITNVDSPATFSQEVQASCEDRGRALAGSEILQSLVSPPFCVLVMFIIYQSRARTMGTA